MFLYIVIRTGGALTCLRTLAYISLTLADKDKYRRRKNRGPGGLSKRQLKDKVHTDNLRKTKSMKETLALGTAVQVKEGELVTDNTNIMVTITATYPFPTSTELVPS